MTDICLDVLIDVAKVLTTVETPKCDSLYTSTGFLKSSIERSLQMMPGDFVEGIRKSASGNALDDYPLMCGSILQKIAETAQADHDHVLSLQQSEVVRELMLLHATTSLVPCTSEGMVNVKSNLLHKLWPKVSDKSVRMTKLKYFATSTLSLLGTPLNHLVITSVFSHILLCLELWNSLTETEMERVHYRELTDTISKYVPQTVICETLFGLIFRTKHDKILMVALDSKLCDIARLEGGIQLVIETIDRLAQDSLWHQMSFCNRLARALLKSKMSKPHAFYPEFVHTITSKTNAHHFGYLPSCVIDWSLKSKKMSKAMQTGLIDLMCSPFEILRETRLDIRNWKVLSEGSVFLVSACISTGRLTGVGDVWDRISGLFAPFVLVLGSLSTEGCNSEARNGLVTILNSILNWQKNPVSLIVSSFLSSHRLNQVPVHDESGNMSIQLKLVDGLSDEEVSDLFLSGLQKLLDSRAESDKFKLLSSVLSEAVSLWTNEHGPEPISYIRDFGSTSTFKSSHIDKGLLLAYFVSNVGLWFTESEAVCQVEFAQQMSSIATSLIKRFRVFVESELANKPKYNGKLEISVDHTRTLQLALAFLGAGLIQPGSSSVDDAASELIQLNDLLQSHEEFIGNDVRILQEQIVDFLKCCGKQCQHDAKPSSSERTSELHMSLQLLETDYEDEVDGSVEIAERGHALVVVAKALQVRDPSIEEDKERVFNVLCDNLRHHDSYVYLSAINAMVQLTMWDYGAFLPKLMFLFRTMECSCTTDNSQSSTSTEVCVRCLKVRVNLGESISRILLEMGDMTSPYFDQLEPSFSATLTSNDPLISASAMSGLANLVLASRGKCIYKTFFEENKEANSALLKTLRQVKRHDIDEVVRLHSELALLDLREAVKTSLVVDSVERNTRVLKL